MKSVRWLLLGLTVVLSVSTVAGVIWAFARDSPVEKTPTESVSVVDSTGSTLSPDDKRELGNKARRLGVVVYVAEAPAWQPGERPGTTVLADLLERKIEVGSDSLPTSVTDSANGTIDTSAAAAIDRSLAVIEKYQDDQNRLRNTATAAIIVFSGGISALIAAGLYLRLSRRKDTA